MAQTGQTLFKYLQQVVGQAYSGYLDTFKADRLFNDALLKAIETKYADQENQKTSDELNSVITTNNTYVPVNNQLSIRPLIVANITILSPVSFQITTALSHDLTTGQSVTISTVQGTLTVPTANGTFLVTVLSPTTFSIFVGSATGVYTAYSGQVTTPSTLPNYWHLLSMKVKFLTPLYDWKITGATNASPIVLTINWYNSFRTGEKLNISGVLGNTNANGEYYIKMINSRQMALYNDINFQSPTVGNGIYTGGGVVSRINFQYVAPYSSEEKIALIFEPTVELPAVEMADTKLKIYPLQNPCSEAIIDYVKIPEYKILTADNSIDLTLIYPEKFLIYVVDVAGKLFAEQVRDPELYQQMSAEKIENP